MNCSRCGNTVAPGAQFCSSCGATLAAGPYGAMPGPKSRPLISTAFVILLAVFFIFMFFAILTAIAVPGFIKARQEARRRACQENLMMIDGAKQQFALDANKAGDYEPNWQEIINPAKRGYLNQQPVCPAGGTYSINSMDEDPECTMKREGHYLP